MSMMFNGRKAPGADRTPGFEIDLASSGLMSIWFDLLGSDSHVDFGGSRNLFFSRRSLRRRAR